MAEVSLDGIITARRVGTTAIKVTSAGGMVDISVKVEPRYEFYKEPGAQWSALDDLEAALGEPDEVYITPMWGGAYKALMYDDPLLLATMYYFEGSRYNPDEDRYTVYTFLQSAVAVRPEDKTLLIGFLSERYKPRQNDFPGAQYKDADYLFRSDFGSYTDMTVYVKIHLDYILVVYGKTKDSVAGNDGFSMDRDFFDKFDALLAAKGFN